MSETTPDYIVTAIEPTQDGEPQPALITDAHMLFLKGLRGHAWITDDFSCMTAQAEQYLSDIIAFVENERRAQGWL